MELVGFAFLPSLIFLLTDMHISFKTPQLLSPCDALPSISSVQGRTVLTNMKILRH